jgi:hypothetical protein
MTVKQDEPVMAGQPMLIVNGDAQHSVGSSGHSTKECT